MTPISPTSHLPQSACPDCVDLDYIDMHGVRHMEFDICDVHRPRFETEAEQLAREEYQRKVDSGSPWELGYG